MIVPVDAERDEQGYWTHPALSGSGCESAADFHDWLSSQGLQCFVMCMCDEAPELFLSGLAGRSLMRVTGCRSRQMMMAGSGICP